MPKQEDLKVFITSRESKCDECKEDLGSKAWIMLAEQKGALCLSCADLDHLVFLPSGIDRALRLHLCRALSSRSIGTIVLCV